MSHPDPYVNSCLICYGNNPDAAIIANAWKMMRATGREAIDAKGQLAAAFVAKNGNPLSYQGPMNPDGPAYPGYEQPPAKPRDLVAELRELIAAGLNFAEAVRPFHEDQMAKEPFVQAYIDGVEQENWVREGQCEIDSFPIVSQSESGAYVLAWAWVDNSTAGIKDEDEGDDRDDEDDEEITDGAG
jgi:hypothetical protein